MSRPLVELHTKRLLITLPPEDEAANVLRYYRDNRDHLEPWAPSPPDDFYTLGYWRRRLRRSERDFEEDRALRLALYDRAAPSTVVGTVNFTEIIRGALQGCNLGYGLAADVQGKGLMTEALRTTIAYVFDHLGLHRISAGYIPSNERSGAVLERVGFVVEGYARDYLFIDGAWRDHVITALVNPDAPPPRLSRRSPR